MEAGIGGKIIGMSAFQKQIQLMYDWYQGSKLEEQQSITGYPDIFTIPCLLFYKLY